MRAVLPLIVISQFLCTSVWFASNAVIANIAGTASKGEEMIAYVTSAVQFGFITGTLLFAVFAISDRLSPSKVFFYCSLFAAIFNFALLISASSEELLYLTRFLTGFFLAGIYPVGMKIASDHFQKGLGRSLGFLVGALVLGTAFPHLIRSFSFSFSWDYVIYTTSACAVLGGLCIYFFVGDGPYRKQAQKISPTTFLSGFKQKNFRSVAIGYFGHMWELYTFWAFVPVMLTMYERSYSTDLNIPLYSFMIIASGMIACFASGILSSYLGSKKVAAIALAASCLCCLVSPVIFQNASTVPFLLFMFLWGMTVIADSPLFSSLVAEYAPERSRGSSLTIVNCIGFAITILSIQFINIISGIIDDQYIFMFLAVGPIIGLISLASPVKK